MAQIVTDEMKTWLVAAWRARDAAWSAVEHAVATLHGTKVAEQTVHEDLPNLAPPSVSAAYYSAVDALVEAQDEAIKREMGYRHPAGSKFFVYVPDNGEVSTAALSTLSRN